MIPKQQGSPEWHNWRKDRLGASDSGAIMGCGFLSIGALFDLKLGLRQPDEENEAMKRGKDMEEEARQAFEKMLDVELYPKCVEHPSLLWMSASLDGITRDGGLICEIKCPGKKDHEVAMKGLVPEKYKAQLQHIMAVTGHEAIYYFSYRDGQGIIVVHPRDDHYIDVLVKREAYFFEMLTRAKAIIKTYEDSLDEMKDMLYRTLENDDTKDRELPA